MNSALLWVSPCPFCEPINDPAGWWRPPQHKALLDVHWSMDGRTQVALRQREGCKYTRVPGSADMYGPIQLTALNGAP